MADFKVLSDLKPTTNDGKSFKPAILAAFQEFQKKFMDMFADLRKEFEELCQEQDQKICALTSEVSQLKKHVSKLEEIESVSSKPWLAPPGASNRKPSSSPTKP